MLRPFTICIIALIVFNVLGSLGKFKPFPRVPTPELDWIHEYNMGQSTQDILYYYVSPDGSDDNPGSESEPFQTIYKAQEIVRSKKDSFNGPITVYFMNGTYELPRTVFFGKEDSGVNSTNAITYAAYPGSYPVFSGGAQIDPQFEVGWSGWSNQNGANNIYGQVPTPGASTEYIKFLGKFDTFGDCKDAAAKNGSFYSYTYMSGSFRFEEWRKTCYARLDQQWKITEEAMVVSGRPYTVYQAYVPELLNTSFASDSLFINGERQWPARFPDADYNNQMVGGSGYRNLVFGIGNSDSNPPTFEEPPRTYGAQPVKGLFYNEDNWSINTTDWKHVTKANVHVFPLYYWGNLIFRIKEVKTNDASIHFGAGGGQINLYKFNYGSDLDASSRFFVENIFEELDGPGEFFCNRTTGMLYLVPREGVNISNVELVFPQLTTLFRFQGDPDPIDTYDQSSYVHDLVFDGLVYAHTLPTYLLPYQVPSGGDWTIHRGGSIFLQTAQKISFTNSIFNKVNGNGIFLDSSCEQILISNNLFKATGDSCVAIVGDSARSIGSALNFPKNCIVSNNYMHNLGFYGKQTAGVFVSVAKDITISNNLIHTMPRAAILINDGFNGGHIIEFNEAFECVMETSDHACYNSWGRERFWTEIFNHLNLANAATPPYFPAGPITWDVLNPITVRNNLFSYYVITADGVIDMDDGTSNHHIYENVCLGGAIKIGSTGDLHHVFNNIFYESSYPLFFWSPMIGNNDTFTNNILTYTNHSINPNEIVLEQEILYFNERWTSFSFDDPLSAKIRPKYHAKSRLSPLYGIARNQLSHSFELADKIDLIVNQKKDELVIAYLISTPGTELPYEIDYNLLYQYNAGDNWGVCDDAETFTIQEWNDLGKDVNSIFGKDPKFEDPNRGNFTVKKDSPALGLGFNNFPYGIQQKVGPSHPNPFMTSEPKRIFGPEPEKKNNS